MEIRISITDEQHEALQKFIRLPKFHGRWQSVEDCISESICGIIRMAVDEAPPPTLFAKKQQIAQIQAEIDNYTKLTNVQIVSAAEPAA